MDFYKNSNVKVDYKVYKKIMTDIFELMFEEMIKGTLLLMPKKLGTISIKKKKTKKNSVDFNATRIYGQTIYHRNLHSEGYYGFTHWDFKMPYGVFTNKGMYKFEPVRKQARKISYNIKHNNTIINYLEVLKKKK